MNMTTFCTLSKHIRRLLIVVSLSAQAQAPAIQLQQVVGGFNYPTDIASAADSRLFISENTGKIRVVANNVILPVPFLDIGNKVKNLQYQGIFSILFHPAYASNGRFFVFYFRTPDGLGVLSEFNVSANNTNIADPTEYQLLTVPYTEVNAGHKGADMAFGKDGYLYLTTGDNASGARGVVGDPTGNAQNLALLFGKILRIDVSQPHQYSIPLSNPFVQPNDNIPDEIWALGLRNPWRISFDSATGDMWLGDNGQDGWEEVNFWKYENTSTPNFGWSCYEGNHLYSPANCPDVAPNAFPLLEFPGFDNNGGVSASVIGGFVYRGSEYPALYGHYIYANYATGEFWTLKRSATVENTPQGVLAGHPVGFGQNAQGDVFVISFQGGTLYKITNNQPCPNTITLTPYDPILKPIAFQTSQQIGAANVVFSGINSDFRAGNSIVLNPGFEAKHGTTFTAQIAGCQ